MKTVRTVYDIFMFNIVLLKSVLKLKGYVIKCVLKFRPFSLLHFAYEVWSSYLNIEKSTGLNN